MSTDNYNELTLCKPGEGMSLPASDIAALANATPNEVEAVLANANIKIVWKSGEPSEEMSFVASYISVMAKATTDEVQVVMTNANTKIVLKRN